MTTPTNRHMVEKAIEASKTRPTYKGWPKPSLDGPFAGVDLQEGFDPHKHPRNRVGRWIDTPDIDASRLAPVGGKRPDRWTGTLPAVKYDPGVEKIGSWDDAVQFMRERRSPDEVSSLKTGDRIMDYGEERTVTAVDPETKRVTLDDGTSLPPTGRTRKLAPGEKPKVWPIFKPNRSGQGEMPNANTSRQIVQAVLDMTKRYPMLKLDLVDMTANLPSNNKIRQFGGEGIWAMTTDGPFDGAAIYLNNFVGGPHSEGLNVDNGHAAHDGVLGPAAASTYGLITHELGHALANSTYDWSGNLTMAVLEKAGLPPQEIGRFSRYGAKSADEGFAEAFAQANVPGALEHVDPELRAPIQSAVADMVQRVKKAQEES